MSLDVGGVHVLVGVNEEFDTEELSTQWSR